MVYENTQNSIGKEISNHYLRLKLKGNSSKVLGTKVYLFANGEIKYADHSNFCGYRSTVDPVIHFGLGNTQKIDSLIVVWPDGM